MTSGEIKNYLANHFSDNPEWSNPKKWIRNCKIVSRNSDDFAEKMQMYYDDLNCNMIDGSPLQNDKKYIIRSFTSPDESLNVFVATDENDEKIVFMEGTED